MDGKEGDVRADEDNRCPREDPPCREREEVAADRKKVVIELSLGFEASAEAQVGTARLALLLTEIKSDQTS